MMEQTRKVYVEAGNIISSLGATTAENLDQVLQEHSGLKPYTDKVFSDITIPASYLDYSAIATQFSALADANAYTRFEQLAILSVKDALEKSKVGLNSGKTLFILSTTKGNIDLLENAQSFPANRLELSTTAAIIAGFFSKELPFMVVSNACISGVAALVLGRRLIAAGLYDTVIVNGTDILTKFVVSGFQSFMSLSENPCKPFDADRNGLSLGEGSATLILTNKSTDIEIVNGATSNDANHISGPSRTGEGLLLAIENTLKGYKDIGFISAHGTATPYNDDMESKAIFRAGLDTVPTNSLKGFFGHTLGAAGVIETVISIELLKKNISIKTLGCVNQGTAEQIKVAQETSTQPMNSFLKLASGFGGCNAAALFVKHD